ncbi:hypothetical protein GMA19_01463 [Paenibacillus polymyxa E681]|nr:hypothetical protein PPE_05490 [Paenibacillus polymyxa E681]QNV56302.1 hypothetical protein GE561_01463 [Paenibacillus polymyxa E681]QNV61139.1 hypothetical protein GMA19_01463 [Paenibacillus polymyxa E681]
MESALALQPGREDKKLQRKKSINKIEAFPS